MIWSELIGHLGHFTLTAASSGINAVKTPHSSGMLGVDLIAMLRETDLIGLSCMGLTMLFSVASWAVIILKLIHIQVASRQTRDFLDEMSGTDNLREAYQVSEEYPDSPVAQLLREGYLELETENWYSEGYEGNEISRVEMARLGMERVLERTIATEMDHLEAYLPVLATTSSVCPFLGLFGTVWGVMIAFQALGQNGAQNIAALAPGLSTALTSTIAGLFAAIPANVGFNYLASRVKILTTRMDSFALELSNVILKQIAKEEAGSASPEGLLEKPRR